MEEMTSEAVWRLLKLTSKTVRIPRVETSCVAAAAGTNRVESANCVESANRVESANWVESADRVETILPSQEDRYYRQ